jgi:hypothetical protein
MRAKLVRALTLAAGLGVAGPAGTDVWDTPAINNDNFSGTAHNQITHGFSQIHDLGALPGPALDVDWYPIYQAPFSSYEILVDGLTGEVFPNPNVLQRVDGAGGVLQDSVNYEVGTPWARSLRFANDTAAAVVSEFVRVANPSCGTSCDADSWYHIHAWDTTIAVPRYNNFGGQLTVLVILWAATGGTVPVTTVPFALPARAAAVINLATVNGGAANGTSGTITITSDARYGHLAVKAVAVEPATGFSFDSPGLYKP